MWKLIWIGIWCLFNQPFRYTMTLGDHVILPSVFVHQNLMNVLNFTDFFIACIY